MQPRYRTLVTAAAGLIAVVGVIAAYVTDDSAPARGAVPAPATATGSPGCGRAPRPSPTAHRGATRDVVQSLQVGGLTRTYRLAVPAGYRSSSPVPLILLFHGSGSDALEMSVYTRMPARAAQLGYLVATPDAIAKQWQVSAPDAATPDLAFVSALIGDLSSRYCVNPLRVYAAGMSLGSEFSVVAGCRTSNQIAAIGLVAAEFPLRPCAAPIPVIAFHGTADPLVAYPKGGVGSSLPGIHVPGVEQNLASWAQLDGCKPGPKLSHVSSMVVRRSWGECERGSHVVLYTVIGGGHSWPGSSITLPVAIFGPTTRQIDATGLMLQFFAHARLRR